MSTSKQNLKKQRRDDMTASELRKAVITDDELSFSHNGWDYLLYGWDQCVGYVLSLVCDGEPVWQSAPKS